MRYLVWGYYGFGNLGDELLLRALRDGILKRDPRAQIYVRCQRAPQLEGIFPFDVEARREPRPLVERLSRYVRDYIGRVYHRLEQIDTLIVGGGTLFIDKGRHNRSLLELMLFVFLARMLNKRVIAVGVGVDELKHPLSKIYFRAILGMVDGAWIREQYGFDLARMVTGGDAKITRSADLAFALPWPPILAHQSSRKLGVVLADYAANYQTRGGSDVVLEAFAGFLRHAVDQMKLEPVFLVFQAGGGYQGDQISHRLLERLGWEGQFAVRTLPPDLKEIASTYSELACLVGMHYHALVLAAQFAVPFIGINHEKKFEDICAQFEMPCLPLAGLTGRQLIETADQLRASLRRPHVPAELRALAERNFDGLAA
jgi:polysaccharide pyruvyl transferase WcaK-like protein